MDREIIVRYEVTVYKPDGKSIYDRRNFCSEDKAKEYIKHNGWQWYELKVVIY